MFERNIIDLVGLFVENVQSLYPCLRDRGWEALLGPRAYPGHDPAPRLQPNKGREGYPFGTDPTGCPRVGFPPGGTWVGRLPSAATSATGIVREKWHLAVYQESTRRLIDREACASIGTLSPSTGTCRWDPPPLQLEEVRPSDFHQGQSSLHGMSRGTLGAGCSWSEGCPQPEPPQRCSSRCSRAAVLGGVGGAVFAIEVLEGYSQTSDTRGQTTPQSPPLPVLQGDTPRERDNLQVADADKLLIMSRAG